MRVLALLGLALVARPHSLSAQADEIQVYDGGLAPRGGVNLTLHNNFTPSGLTTPAFPGGITPDNSWNGVPEWALGVTDWFEAGLYLPLYSIGTRTGGSGAMLNGFKLRFLFAVPRADDRVAYHLSPAWALAVEEYADFGPLHQFYGRGEQAHQHYAVVDHTARALDIEAGVGFGLTAATDTLTLKLILARDLR